MTLDLIHLLESIQSKTEVADLDYHNLCQQLIPMNEYCFTRLRYFKKLIAHIHVGKEETLTEKGFVG